MKIDWDNLPEVLPEDIREYIAQKWLYADKQIKLGDFTANGECNDINQKLTSDQWWQVARLVDEYKKAAYIEWQKNATQEDWDARSRMGRKYLAREEGIFTKILNLYYMVNQLPPFEGWDTETVEKHKIYTFYTPICIRRSYMTENEKLYFFCEDTPLSTYYQTSITIDGNNFLSVFHYMLYRKVESFIDRKAMAIVLNMNELSAMKKMYRDNTYLFNKDVWANTVGDALRTGYTALFDQDKIARAALEATSGKTLALADPNDQKWSIGMKADDPRCLKRSEWSGKNLLGELLTEIRVEITGKY